MENHNNLMPLHLQVRAKRREKNLSQMELSAISGVSISLIEKLESGVHTSISIQTLRLLSIGLDYYDWDLNLLGTQF